MSGSIPIVYSTPFDRTFHNLPVLIIESLADITPEYLEKKVERERSVSPESYEYFIKGKYLSSTAKSKIDIEIVQDLYKKAIEIGMKKPNVTYDYMSFAYVGLARIYEAKNDHKKAKIYYKRTLEYAEYESIRDQAKKYLKKY